MNDQFISLITGKYPDLFLDSFSDFYFTCNVGWFELVDTALSLLDNLNPSLKIESIRKYNDGLRIYVYLTSYENVDFLEGVLQMSYSLSQLICEKCTAFGDLQEGNGTVLCSAHGGQPSNRRLRTKDDSDLSSRMLNEILISLWQMIGLNKRQGLMPEVQNIVMDIDNDRLSVVYEGGNDITKGMARLIESYCLKIDINTGLPKNPISFTKTINL